MFRVFLALFLLYALALALVTWQAWRLRALLRSPSWTWRIAGFSVAFVGFSVVTALQFVVFPADKPDLLTPTEAFTLAAFLWRIGSLTCFAIEQHLLHTALNRLFEEESHS